MQFQNQKLAFISMLMSIAFTALPSYAVTAPANKTTVENKQTDANQVDKNKNYTYTEDKQNILVTYSHAEFTIKLKSNPTTGFSWFLREYDNNLVQPVKHSFLPSDSGLMGAPGYELWTFKIKPAGFVVPHQSSIRFIYARPWQGSDSSTQMVFRISTMGK